MIANFFYDLNYGTKYILKMVDNWFRYQWKKNWVINFASKCKKKKCFMQKLYTIGKYSPNKPGHYLSK